MKKYRYIFLAIILIHIQMMQAQDIKSLVKDAKIGIKGMINIADMTVNPSHQVDSKILGGFGAFAQTKLTDQITIQPELLYSMQGGVQHTFAPNVTDYEYISDKKLTYLLLPLMGQYHFDQFYVEAGIQPAFLFSATYHYQAVDDGKIVVDKSANISDQTHTFDLGFNIGIGYQINDRLHANIRYTKGLLAINKSSGVSLKNSVVSFSVGYIILN